MRCVADWTDGPEYAPQNRPDVFVGPTAPPLDQGATLEPPRLEEARPAPAAYTGPEDARPLDVMEPPSDPQRDPREPFAVVALATSPTTANTPPMDQAPAAPGAWGGVHASPPTPTAWSPEQPIGAAPAPDASAAPAPTSGGIPAPPPAWPTPSGGPSAPPAWPAPTGAPANAPFTPPSEPVNLPAILRAATPGVLICLGLGVLLGNLSLLLLFLAQALSARITCRGTLIRRIFTISTLSALTLGLAGSVLASGQWDLFTWLDGAAGWARLACLILLIAVPWIVGRAMRQQTPLTGRH